MDLSETANYLTLPGLSEKSSKKHYTRRQIILALCEIIKNAQGRNTLLTDTLSMHYSQQLERLGYQMVLELISNAPREASSIYSGIVARLLHYYPRVASLNDRNNFLLIHHLSYMESPDISVLSALLAVHPASAGVYAVFPNDLLLTPLLLVLYKSEVIDYSIANLLLNAYPRCARLEAFNGKFPIHFALSDLFDDSCTECTADHFLFIEQLLEHYPEGMFKQVSEEMSFLQEVTCPDNPLVASICPSYSNGSDNSPSPSFTSSVMENDDQWFSNMTIFLGQSQYNVESHVCEWSPWQKVMELNTERNSRHKNSYHESLRRLFTIALDKFTRQALKSQWKAKRN